MKEINYIVYGHTSYLDILEIQSDYIRNYGNVTLFLNSNDLELDGLYAKYDRVIFYDDNVQYAKRLIHCLNQIDDEYFLLIHESFCRVDNKLIYLCGVDDTPIGFVLQSTYKKH